MLAAMLVIDYYGKMPPPKVVAKVAMHEGARGDKLARQRFAIIIAPKAILHLNT